MDRPFFTVVMPAYGVEKYLKKAVDSIRSQTFEDWELIIVEDGSPGPGQGNWPRGWREKIPGSGRSIMRKIKDSARPEIPASVMQTESISGLWIRMILWKKASFRMCGRPSRKIRHVGQYLVMWKSIMRKTAASLMLIR